jgi:hypothetical protein
MRLFLNEAAQFAAMSRNAGPGQTEGKPLKHSSRASRAPSRVRTAAHEE